MQISHQCQQEVLDKLLVHPVQIHAPPHLDPQIGLFCVLVVLFEEGPLVLLAIHVRVYGLEVMNCDSVFD